MVLLKTERFAKSKPFFVKCLKFFDIPTHTINLHRSLRTDADNLTPILHTLNEIELLIIRLHMMTQHHAQTRIVAIEEARHLELALRRTETAITRQYNDIRTRAP